MENKDEESIIVKRNKRGQLGVSLPSHIGEALYKQSGIRSKKKRQIKKAVRKQLNKILWDYWNKLKTF